MKTKHHTILVGIWRWIGLSGLGVMLVGCGVRLGPVYLGQPAAPATPFAPAHTLLITAAPFPEGWQAQACDPRECQNEGIRHASRSFYEPDSPGVVIQEVIWYDTEQEATEEFQRIHAIEFRIDQPTALTPAPEITYQPTQADAYEVGCGDNRIMICRAMLRYGQYVVLLYVTVDEAKLKGLTKHEINPILEAVDQHSAGVLAGAGNE